MLANKSLVELRGIAQSLSIPDIFQKDSVQLVQAIELKQQSFAPAPKIEIPVHVVTVTDAMECTPEQVKAACKPFTDRGLHLSFTDTQWKMKHGKKADEGTLKMPIRIVIKCAQKVMDAK